VPEASLHLLKAVVASSVGEVQLSDIARALVAENQALLSGQCGVHSIPHTACTMVTSTSGAVLQLSRRLNGTCVGLEVHTHQRLLGVGVEVAAVKASVGQIALLTAVAEESVGVMADESLLLLRTEQTGRAAALALSNGENVGGVDSGSGAHTSASILAALIALLTSTATRRWRGSIATAPTSAAHTRADASLGLLDRQGNKDENGKEDCGLHG